MKKILPMVFFCVFLIGCNNDWEPDFYVAKDVREIRLSGLTEKPGIELEIGYYKTNNYKTKQMFKKYTKDIIDYFSPGIDITYFSYNDSNPPKYRYKHTFEDHILTVITYYFEENTDK